MKIKGKKIPNHPYAIVLTAIFLLVGTIVAVHHEMWRDELQAWLIARDSTSLIELFRHLKYEGHPGLWHVLLMPLSRITQSPVIMQVSHLLITTTTVYLFVRYAPFNQFQKFLFVFGYFPVYEYSILCRNYGIGLLLICLFCILFSRRYSKFLLVGAILFLLGHTSVHALIIVIAIGCGLMLDFLLTRKRVLAEGHNGEWQIWVGFSLIALGIITSVLQLNPPADTGFAIAWKWDFDVEHLRKVVKIMTRAFFPIPKAELGFWGSQWLENYAFFTGIQLHLSYLLMIWFALVLLRKPSALLTYLMGTIGLLTFFYVKYFGSMRHHGFLFLLFITVAWVYQHCGEIKLERLSRLSTAWGKSLSPILTLILVFHFIGGITAIRMDYRHVFSYGKRTAEYIKAANMQDMLMVGHGDFAVSTVVGYLEQDAVHYMRGDRPGSFVRWDNLRNHDVSNEQVVQKAKELRDEQKQAVLIIMNRALGKALISRYALIELAKFTGSTVSSEEFYLYLMPKASLGEP
jgi:hypothetical protein